MAAPSAPSNLSITQGDGKVALLWDQVSGATSYTIQRSVDNITFAVVGNPTLNQYLDTSVTLGTIYYYQVASTNSSGTGLYTDSVSAVPTMGSEMSLGELDVRCRQRADRLNSNFVTTSEIYSYINQSLYELYDILITLYEDYFKAPDAIFYSSNNQQFYPVPNGVDTFYDNNQQAFVPAPIYKLLGLDLGLNTSNNGWVTVSKFNFIDRNKYFYPNTASTIYGIFNCQYRWMGDKLELIPPPSSNQPFRILYIPRLASLLQPQDITTTSISGWLEYVITDVAIKILQKEESDTSVLMGQKMALLMRINSSASNKDAGRPDTISDVRGPGNGGSWGGTNFPGGGF